MGMTLIGRDTWLVHWRFAIRFCPEASRSGGHLSNQGARWSRKKIHDPSIFSRVGGQQQTPTQVVSENRKVQESIGAIANGRLSQAFDGWKYRQPAERDALDWFVIVVQLDLEHCSWT